MICAVVLAAGRSRRMGTQKLLLPIGGRPLIARIVDELLASPIAQIYVVVGADRERLGEALAGRSVRFVVNSAEQGDMLSSVRCGLAALPPECAAALVVLGDQPRLTAALAADLIRAYRDSHRGLIMPSSAGRRGHPLLLTLRYRDEVLTKFDGIGLLGLLNAHPDDICEVPVAAPEILEDLDVPEDLVRLGLQASVGPEIPSPP